MHPFVSVCNTMAWIQHVWHSYRGFCGPVSVD